MAALNGSRWAPELMSDLRTLEVGENKHGLVHTHWDPICLSTGAMANHTPCSRHNQTHCLKQFSPTHAPLPLHVPVFLPELLFLLFCNR